MYRAIGKPLSVTIAVWLLVSTGCGKTKPNGHKDVFPVRGIVIYRGKPAAGAEIALHPMGELPTKALCPCATTDKEGRFALTTYEPGDGAPAGQYVVTIVWPGVPPQNMPGDPGPDRMGGRYNDRNKPAWCVEVKPQTNELPPFHIE